MHFEGSKTNSKQMLISLLQYVICDLQLIKVEYEIPHFTDFTAWLLYNIPLYPVSLRSETYFPNTPHAGFLRESILQLYCGLEILHLAKHSLLNCRGEIKA